MKKKTAVILSLALVLTASGCRQRTIVRNKDEAVSTKIVATKENTSANPDTKLTTSAGNNIPATGTPNTAPVTSPNKITKSTYSGNPITVPFTDAETQAETTQQESTVPSTQPEITQPPEKKKITVAAGIKVYATSMDAKERRSPVTSYSPGEYYIFSEENGMVNISKNKENQGGWVNPSDLVTGEKDSEGNLKTKIYIPVPVNIYATSYDAASKSNKVTQFGAGEYFIFSEDQGMYNITTDPDTPAGWMNPEETGIEVSTVPDNKTTVSETDASEETVEVKNKVPVYASSRDASVKKNSISEYSPGTYYIYKKENGMINISRKAGSAGAWINPESIGQTPETTTEEETTKEPLSTTSVPEKTTTSQAETTTVKETTTEEETTTETETTTEEKTTATETTTPKTQPVKTLPSYRGKKIIVKESIPVYETSLDAKNRENAVNEYPAGEYFFYKEENGMVNITDEEGYAGAWINPLDGIGAKDLPKPTTTTEVETTTEADTTTETETTTEEKTTVTDTTTPKTQPVKTLGSYKGKKIIISESIPVYETSLDARNRENAVNEYPAGEYLFYKEENGMVNITDEEGSAGAWINPLDGVDTKDMPKTEETTTETVTTTVMVETTSTSPVSPEVYEGKKIVLNNPIGVYGTAEDARNSENPLKTYDKGEYFFYKESDGMINISSSEGEAGGWINPSEGITLKDISGNAETTSTETSQNETTEKTRPGESVDNIKIKTGDKITLSDPVSAYPTAEDALNGGDFSVTYQTGEYYIYKISGDAVNISREKESAGGWVRTSDIGVKPAGNASSGEENKLKEADFTGAGLKMNYPSAWDDPQLSGDSLSFYEGNVSLTFESSAAQDDLKAQEYIAEITGEKGKKAPVLQGSSEGYYYASPDGLSSVYVYKLSGRMLVIRITSEEKLSSEEKKDIDTILKSVKISE